MAEHSPLPWEVHDAGTPQPTVCHRRENDTCHMVCDCGVMQGVYDTPMALADAELIVRCVNMHDELVKALDDASYIVSQSMGEGCMHALELHERIDALLAKAKGET
jgi:hypothetical protein